MLLLDVSNIMYTGASARSYYFGEASEFKIKSIPYFLQQIASYYSVDTEMIAVFEKVGRIPALARDGYKSGRNRNPLVEWEIQALKTLLESVGFPILYVEGAEADHVISNYCRINRDYENIHIVSADQDLACNVRHGQYSTRMLSYSTVSYNIEKASFKEITGIDYNFMNINKILLGCKSDNIKPLPAGREIYKSFMSTLFSLWRRKHGYNPREHSPSDFDDDIIIPYTQYEYFIEWFKTSSYFDQSTFEELGRRRTLIEGKIFDLPPVTRVDWEAYNSLVAAFNLGNIASIKAVRSPSYDPAMYENVVRILRQAKNTNSTMFDAEVNELEELVEVSNITNVLGILDNGGVL